MRTLRAVVWPLVPVTALDAASAAQAANQATSDARMADEKADRMFQRSLRNISR